MKVQRTEQWYATKQRAITQINRYKGWRAEKYVGNKVTRTENQFKERTHTSSRETETEENDRENTNQTGIKDWRCYACGTKGHKIKDYESKLNIYFAFKENLSPQELRKIMEEYGTVKIIKIKEVQTGQKKQAMVCFSKESEIQEVITETKWCEVLNSEVYRNVYNKQRTSKISRIYEDKQEHNTSTKSKTEGDLEKELEKMRNDIKEIKKSILNKNKDWLEISENIRDSQKEKIEKGEEEE